MDECYDDNDIINLQILEESTQTKNENVDESDPKLNSSDPKLNCSDPKLNSTPIVYTTRLEEMFVMNNNNFGEIFVKKALQDIETESKPRIGDKMYKMICKTNQPVHLIYKLRYLRNNPADKQYSLSHQEPLDTTRRRRSANTKEPVLTESFRLKNAKLLSLCKPLTIRLEKLVIKHVYNKTKPQVIMVNKTESKPIVFIMKDITANETDIYYIKNKVLKEHFKLTGVYNKIDEPYMSAYKRAGVETKKISFCCWQNRENYLSTFRMQEKKFMGKLHYCQNGKCTCCCAQVMIRHNENKDIVPEKLDSKKLQSVSDVEILDLEKEVEEEIEETKQSTFEYGYNTDWLKDLLSSNNSDTLINKALNYDPANKSVTNKNVSPSNEFASQQRETKEYIKNVLRRFDLNDTRELEFYKFSEEGLLEMYVKEPQNSEPCFSKIFSKDMTCSSIRKDAICCWQKREHIIRNVSHDYPVLAKFLTAPHPCSPTQCKCCCSMYKLKKKLILKDISLSERNTPRHTQPYVNVTKMPKTNRRKNVHRAEPAAYLLEIPSAGINTLYADISNTLLESRYRQKPPRITYGLSDNVMGRPHKHTPSHTLGDATAGPSFSNTLKNDIPQKDKPTEINFQTTPTQLRLSKTMPNQKIISSPNVTAPVMEVSSDRLSQAPSIDSMISSVLERFKDVRLTINEDGKVAAALNVPVNTLSTAELKVLANILAHAQEQVQAIGLANSTGVTPKIPDITECMRATANISNIGETHIIQSTSMPSAPPPPVQNLSNNFSNSNNIKNASAQESKKQLFSNFSEIMNDKNETFMASFTTYVDAIKEDTEDSHVPVISSVFSLKDKNLDKQLSSTLDAWSEGPENKELSAKNVSSRNSSTETHDTSSLKRTSETEKPTTAKIRVVDPSKLGITNNFEESIPSKTVKILNNDLGNSNNTQDFTSKMHVQGRIGNSIVTPNTLTDDPLYCTSNVTSDIGLLPTTIFVNPITNTAGNNEQVKQVFYLQSPQTANRASAPTNSLNYQKAFTNSPNYNNVRIMRPVAPGIGQGNLTTNPNRFEYRIENIDSASNLNCINLVPVTVTQANPAGTIPPPPLLKRSTRRKQTLKKVTRNAGPSPAQAEKLVGLMETRSDLATGHARTANARTRMRNGWSEIARVLNSDGSGCVKDWKQWAKYWKDKKASVKRKANMAEAARQRTGGGVDAEEVELSELERRILTIAGGLSFATGDRHLAINPFPDQENTAPLPAVPLPASSEPNSSVSESVLLQGNPGPSGDFTMMVLEEPLQWDETAAASVGEGSLREVLEPPPAATPGNEVAVVRLAVQDEGEDEMVSPSESEALEERTERESPPAPTVRPRVGGARRRILVATPSQRRRPAPPSQRPSTSGASPRLRRDIHVSPRGAARGSAARRRLLRRSPPSQRRFEMANLTERFIAIEERRVDAELAIARAQEMFAQGHRMMAEALDRFTETISHVAPNIIGALQHQRAGNN